jgi:aminopeptidase N
MAADAGNILDEYAKQWGPLPTTNIAVSPIPGTFGQGFPGLIYLSMLSYLRQNERPPNIREPLLDTFFSDILLPHEIAHQWWGNFVTADDYRSEWLMEAMANYVALQRLKERRGAAALNAVLSNYESELSRIARNGKPVDAAGPVDMGLRLRESDNPDSWRVITYDKGSWILHMLHQRLGDRNFSALLKAMVMEFSKKPITNDAFRQLASRFMPEGAPDRSLELFFDSWVYGTGIPKLSLVPGKPGSGEMTLKQEGVDGEFAVDVPIVIATAGEGREQVKWVRSSSEGTSFDVPRQAHARLPDRAEFLHRQ